MQLLPSSFQYTLQQGLSSPCLHNIDVLNPINTPGRSVEPQVRSLDWEDPLEKELETHARILAWKSP